LRLPLARPRLFSLLYFFQIPDLHPQTAEIAINMTRHAVIRLKRRMHPEQTTVSAPEMSPVLMERNGTTLAAAITHDEESPTKSGQPRG
jgi:hypothetical protein